VSFPCFRKPSDPYYRGGCEIFLLYYHVRTQPWKMGASGPSLRPTVFDFFLLQSPVWSSRHFLKILRPLSSSRCAAKEDRLFKPFPTNSKSRCKTRSHPYLAPCRLNRRVSSPRHNEPNLLAVVRPLGEKSMNMVVGLSASVREHAPTL
jgi:hypothetical protein